MILFTHVFNYFFKLKLQNKISHIVYTVQYTVNYVVHNTFNFGGKIHTIGRYLFLTLEID